MVLDTSAMIAVIFGEEGWEELASIIQGETENFISAVSLLEAALVLTNRGLSTPVQRLLEFQSIHRAQSVPFDQQHFLEATRAFQLFGKGRHKAALNFGDCASYATASLRRDALLYIGNDFSYTDIQSALVL